MSDQHGGSTKQTLTIWFWLLGLTAVEVFLAYKQVSFMIMLTVLLGLSIVKSFLIVAYFMHLKFERRSLIFTLVPAMVGTIVMLFVVYPDSLRVLNYRESVAPAPVPAPVTEPKE